MVVTNTSRTPQKPRLSLKSLLKISWKMLHYVHTGGAKYYLLILAGFFAYMRILWSIKTGASEKKIGATHFWALRGDFMLFYPQIGGPWEIA